MSDAYAGTPSFDDLYPEREELRGEQWLDRLGVAVTGSISRKLRANPFRVSAITPAAFVHTGQRLCNRHSPAMGISW